MREGGSLPISVAIERMRERGIWIADRVAAQALELEASG